MSLRETRGMILPSDSSQRQFRRIATIFTEKGFNFTGGTIWTAKKEIQGLDIHLPFSKEKRESLLAMEKEPESGSEKLLKKLQVFRMLEEMGGG